jgi:hypothetical protein
VGDGLMWNQEQAIKLCGEVESICPKFGCHVALTGGTLYKSDNRKDVDILFYRIRQVKQIDKTELFLALRKIGLRLKKDYGWCAKANYYGKSVDCFFPEDSGEYETDGKDDDQDEIEF